ncbi:MAG TPA: hypothetical protein P5092_20690 [Ruminococcus sp.]|nr:hypothetical protein [Ruminococcus sp.]
MENNRIPKNLYNGSGTNTESRKAQQTAGTADRKPETLKKIEAEMDKRAADIALTVSDMFKFMAMTAAMLPNMEMDVGVFRLKIDDEGVFFEIRYPDDFRKKLRGDSGVSAKTPENDDDDEEGLIYDGD